MHNILERIEKAFIGVGVLRIDWDSRQIFVSPELFFEIVPKDNVGLKTECRKHSTDFPYRASFTVDGVTYYTIMTEKERDFRLKQRRPPEGGTTNYMFKSSIAQKKGVCNDTRV